MILFERTAIHSISRMAEIISAAIMPARSVKVMNSSSASGTGPVRRTVTPSSGVKCSPRAIRRSSFVAAAPGVSLV